MLFSCFLVAALLALTLAPRIGWTAPAALAGYVLIVALAGAFVLAERRSKAPLLDMSLFRVGAFGLGALSSVVTFMGVSATRFLAPFFLQSVKGFDPSRVGVGSYSKQ